ncbi:MAG: hypothetical protein FD176_3095 [Rhodospirillaceae bacterium]|nr:MAG: hypothetical protein FD176_3095 [Rhodospirillaceae bacterium]TNC98574.1 MAG: hypothetical protein FD119_45 [Stygiobacter sp.]
MTVAVSDSDVQEFADHCFYMHCVFEYLETLYETSDAADQQRMHNAAQFFFADLKRILIEYITQQICNITVPPVTNIKGGVAVNHTVAFFVEYSDFGAADAEFERLKVLRAEMEAFRKKLEPARNKFTAHRDRDAILAGQALGAAPVEDWAAFWLHLQEFVEILHRRYIGTGFNIKGPLSDAYALLKALRHGSYFDALSGPDKDLAKRCLQVVDLPGL